jgi:hypothetical protein
LFHGFSLCVHFVANGENKHNLESKRPHYLAHH